MSDEPAKPQHPDPPVTGMASAVVAFANLVNKMTNEKILLVAVVAVMGFVVYYGQAGVSERESNMARRYDESREQDRRHCDDREDRAEQKRAQESKDLRLWFAGQAEMQRRHDAEREEKMARVSMERDEKVRGILTMILAKLENLKP